MQTEDSDTDIKGVCFAPLSHYIGLGHFEQYEAPQEDTVIYELRKFCRLALNCNPSIIELLWLPEYLDCTSEGQKLLEVREKFLSIRAVDSFAGYATAQINKCHRKAEDPNCQAGIKAKNPYKHAAHCMRLLLMGLELVGEGKITVKRKEADYLLSIKEGQQPLEEVLKHAEELRHQLDRFKGFAALPAVPQYPDTQAVEAVVQELLKEYIHNA